MYEIKRRGLLSVIIGLVLASAMTFPYLKPASSITLNRLNFVDPETTIPIPNPQFVSVNPNTNMLYVTTSYGDLYAVNGSAKYKIMTINSTISGLALNPFTNKLYVIGNTPETISVITFGKTGNEKIKVKEIPLHGYLQSIAVNPNTNMIYVSNHDTILVINGLNDEIINNIKSPRIVKSIVLNPLDDFMYISTFFNNSILVIDTKKNKLSTDISIPVRTWDMSIDTKTNSIYLTAEGGSRVFVINGYSKTLLKPIIAGNVSAYEVPKIAVNPNTNRIYVSHPNSDTVSVIDGSRGFLTQIPVGKHPSALAVNPNTNMVYVANTESNTLSVINGFMITDDPSQLTAETPGIKVGNQPTSIAVNPNTNMVYVANTDSKTVSVINGSNDKVELNIHIPEGPSQIVVNPNTNMIYIHTSEDQGLTIINGSKNMIVKHIANLGSELTSTTWPDLSVGISPISNKIYVVQFPKTIIQIDGKTNKYKTTSVTQAPDALDAISPVATSNQGIDRIYALHATNRQHYALYLIDIRNNKTGIYNTAVQVIHLERPYRAIGVNSNTNITYLISPDSNTFSILDLYMGKIVSNLFVGNVPTAIAVNSNTNMIYVANSGSNTVSVIDGALNEEVVLVKFSINPPNVGHIKCNNTDITTNEYTEIAVGTQCSAEATGGFAFNSVTEDLGHNSSKTIPTTEVSYSPFNSLLNFLGLHSNANSATFNITHYGRFAANFEKVPPPIRQEYLIGLYTLAATIFAGWFVPNFARWISSLSQRKRLMEYLITMDSLDKAVDTNVHLLDEIRSKLTYSYAKGKISDTHYSIINKRISDYENNRNVSKRS